MVPTSLRRSSRPVIRALLCVVGFAAFVMPGGVHAASFQVEMTLRPIGQPGPFFDVTMRPGETRSLEVEIANVGDVSLAARTYATDVYTIVNGGFGARLRAEPLTGMTRWLDYPTAVLALEAGARVQRTLFVAVPADALPGEYAASLVLENDQPIPGSGAVTFDQLIRHAIAVVVTVPGRRSPALAVGGASYSIVAGTAKVAVAVENTGNVRLKPIVGFVLIDASGGEVGRARVAMDTFYAHTSTFVEVALTAIPAPGAYTVRLTLDDPAAGLASTPAAIALVVNPPPPGLVVDPGLPGVTGVTEAARDAGEGLVSLPVAATVLVAGLGLGLVGIGFILRLRRRGSTTGSER